MGVGDWYGAGRDRVLGIGVGQVEGGVKEVEGGCWGKFHNKYKQLQIYQHYHCYNNQKV